MPEALAPHYARALADALFRPESGISPEQAVEQLQSADALLASSQELQRAMLSPAVSRARKKAIISRLADELGLHRIVHNFLLVVVSHRRIQELHAIRLRFELEVDERLGWLPADIASAKELSAEQKEQIERTLGSKLGKFIRAHYTVDPTLLAGVRARVASKEYDATLRGKLESMRQRLAASH